MPLTTKEILFQWKIRSHQTSFRKFWFDWLSCGCSFLVQSPCSISMLYHSQARRCCTDHSGEYRSCTHVLTVGRDRAVYDILRYYCRGRDHWTSNIDIQCIMNNSSANWNQKSCFFAKNGELHEYFGLLRNYYCVCFTGKMKYQKHLSSSHNRVTTTSGWEPSLRALTYSRIHIPTCASILWWGSKMSRFNGLSGKQMWTMRSSHWQIFGRLTFKLFEPEWIGGTEPGQLDNRAGHLDD